MQSKKFTVEDKHTAKNMGSGGLDVLATPALVAFLENVAFEDGAAHCEEGKTTVGSEMNMKHLAPTAVGSEIEVRLSDKQVSGKKLTYYLEAVEGNKQIATATHVRFIVDEGKFMGSL